MDLYGLALFVHVTGVIVWLGSGVVFLLLTERAAKSDDPARIKTLVDVGNGFGDTFFGVVTLVVLASGVWLVLQGDWGFDHLFIIGGLAGLVSSAVIGGVVFGPAAERLEQNLTNATTIGPELRRDITKLRTIGRVDMGVMFIVVFLMTVKPGP